MSLAYFWRLLFLCSATLFVVNALAGLAVRLFTPRLIRMGLGMRPRRAAYLLLAARLFPSALAIFAVLGLCVPSYLWLEPGATQEQVGLACLAGAFLGAALCAFSLARAGRALLATFKFTRRCRESAFEYRMHGESRPVFVLEQDEPVLAMAGVIHPQLVISRGVLQTLSPNQLDAAIRHERGHRSSSDNFKRLLLMLAPGIFPFPRTYAALESAWCKFSEWAADDFAVANDVHRSISLATALVRFARMGEATRLSPLCTTFVPNEWELSARVDRLLCPVLSKKKPMKRPARGVIAVAAIVMGWLLILAISQPVTLHSVHEILERLTH